jgi:hypothetical protein
MLLRFKRFPHPVPLLTAPNGEGILLESKNNSEETGWVMEMRSNPTLFG